jgi:hypothetical protein
MDAVRSPATALLIALMFFGAILPAGEFLIRSTDLRIKPGTGITIDGKFVGIAPCEMRLKTKIRHKFELKSPDRTVKIYFLTVRNLKTSEVVDNIPAWFLNPTSRQSEFKDYETFTPATAIAGSISDALSKAEADGRSKLAKGGVNHYFTVKESDGKGKLDSSKSKYYPRLTRGQMDSLAAVNGGKIVAGSFSEADEAIFLEYEIQRIGDQYRVYVLAGEKRN